MIIVMEGLDKLGKSTQAMMLWEWLHNKKARQVEYHKQPDNTGDGLKGKLRTLLKDPTIKLSPMAEWALHLASHANQWQHSITPALRKNKIVILDRSWLSALVYQGYGKGIPPEIIIKAEQQACQNAKFNMVFIFYSALRNPLGNSFDNHPMEQRLSFDEDYRRKVSEGYFKICQDLGYTLIDVEEYKNNKERLHRFIRNLVWETIKEGEIDDE